MTKNVTRLQYKIFSHTILRELLLNNVCSVASCRFMEVKSMTELHGLGYVWVESDRKGVV